MKDYRIELSQILRNKAEEGLSVLSTLTVADKDFASTVVNIINCQNEANSLEEKIAFDKEMLEKETKEGEEK